MNEIMIEALTRFVLELKKRDAEDLRTALIDRINSLHGLGKERTEILREILEVVTKNS